MFALCLTEQNRTEQNKTSISYISQATTWHMRVIAYIITFCFNVKVWRKIISMATILSAVLMFGTANIDYIFFIPVIVCGRREIRD